MKSEGQSSRVRIGKDVVHDVQEFRSKSAGITLD